jgi:hypothetical protein
MSELPDFDQALPIDFGPKAPRHTCWYCGGGEERFQTEDLVPVSRGGGDRDNVVDACVSCNSLRPAHRRGVPPGAPFGSVSLRRVRWRGHHYGAGDTHPLDPIAGCRP